MRCAASPGSYWRNCQKLSPCPTRRLPCTPCATVLATRSAATSKGGSAAASSSARCWTLTGSAISAATRYRGVHVRRDPPSSALSLQRHRQLVDDLGQRDAVGAGRKVQRHAMAQHRRGECQHI